MRAAGMARGTRSDSRARRTLLSGSPGATQRSSPQHLAALQAREVADKGDAEMPRRLFVGNLAYAVTEDDLRELFGQLGACESVSIVLDRDTGQSRGFGFVTMTNADEAERAKKQL